MKRHLLLSASLALGGLLMADALPAFAQSRAFISNERDHTMTVLDMDTLKVIETVKTGRRPRGITASPDGKLIYVCASDDNRVEVYDAKTLKLVKTLRSGPDPELFVLHPSGNPLYIANEDDNMVTVVNVENNDLIAEIPVGVEPEGMGISPDGKYMVNTSETTNMAHVVDTATNEIIENILVDSRPRIAEFSADGKQLWVSSEVGGTVSVIDPATWKIIKKISFKIPGVADDAIQPVGVRITKDGSKAFVALGPANRVAVINPKTLEVEKYLLVGQRVWQLGFTPDQKFLISTNGNSNDVSIIDVAAEKVTKSVTTGRAPWGVVVVP
ncbi:PQQ-dependent catabolism-associated beta-propeller protein [Ancylobacter radicis]|uniref:PQQ-dependent catabolism-associated beta-propeller protein n=1 Tax=Ancylobacter radicis TaxID=2836179 RepID=A0ABS5RAU8_9HYPH|nr:PQQ-dependent catabolism-associated beta-propeller protein [Ancylobacter radicis]MBS9478036.1 PQQ-dependent catabolism-associated beta-propeller protein [Ancylobacter radicis]